MWWRWRRWPRRWPRADNASLVLIDQSALADEGALDTFMQVGAPSPTVLWRGDVPEEVARVAQVIAKPIAGPALLDLLFGTAANRKPHSSLVQRAA